MLTITPLYAGLLAILFIALSLRVVRNRIRLQILLGDGADADTAARIRVHANCAEYAPLGLILLAMAEIQGLPGWLVHLFGLALLAGRLLHAWGMSARPQKLWARKAGMALTFTEIGAMALVCITLSLF